MFKLRTKPTQFVRGKTEETLCDILSRLEEMRFIENDFDLYQFNNSSSSIKTHLIDSLYQYQLEQLYFGCY